MGVRFAGNQEGPRRVNGRPHGTRELTPNAIRKPTEAVAAFAEPFRVPQNVEATQC